MAKEYCRYSLFPTKHVRNLPHEYTFGHGLGLSTFVVDYTTTDQLDLCRKMINDAAIRGDNVGIDEYSKDNEATNLLFSLSEIFQATDLTNGQIKAFMFIQLCLYQRCLDSCTASIYVFRSGDVDDVVYAELMSLTAEFAKAIDVGYTQCFTHVALCFPFLFQELRRQGFLTVAVLPDWVEIAGVGVRENAIMVKQLGMPERPVRSKDDVLKIVQSFVTPERVAREYTNISLPAVPGLPKTTVSQSGMMLVFRNARKEEDEIMYNWFFDAIEKGDGFSVYEIPSIDFFRVMVLAKSYTLVIEEETTNELIGFLIFQNCINYRRTMGRVSEAYFIVKEEYRGQRLGSAIHPIALQIGKSLGYECELRNTFISNQYNLSAWRRKSILLLGVLPKGAYQMGVGWIDLGLAIAHYENRNQTLSENASAFCHDLNNENAFSKL